MSSEVAPLMCERHTCCNCGTDLRGIQSKVFIATVRVRGKGWPTIQRYFCSHACKNNYTCEKVCQRCKCDDRSLGKTQGGRMKLCRGDANTGALGCYSFAYVGFF